MLFAYLYDQVQGLPASALQARLRKQSTRHKLIGLKKMHYTGSGVSGVKH